MQIIKALPPHGGFAERPPARHRLLSMLLTTFYHKNGVFHKKNGATAGGIIIPLMVAEIPHAMAGPGSDGGDSFHGR